DSPPARRRTPPLLHALLGERRCRDAGAGIARRTRPDEVEKRVRLARAATHLEELFRLRELAKGSKQYAAAIQAESKREVKRGEASDCYVKRRGNVRPPMSPKQY